MDKKVLMIIMAVVLFAISSSTVFARPLNTSFFFNRFFSTPKGTSKPTPTPSIKPSSTPSPTPTTNPLSKGLVTLTLDDGAKSQYQNAWPIMQKYGFRGTFYITTGNLDGYWYMTPTMVQNLYKAGNHIGAHTIDHKDLVTLSNEEVERELREPQEYLEKLLGTSIKDFATPYGSFNDSVMTHIKQYYRSHRGVNEGLNSKQPSNVYNLLVRNIYNTTSADQVKSWVTEAKNKNVWVILLYHEVTDNPDQWSTTPEMFDTHLQAIKDSGIPVVTIDQVLQN